MTYHQWRNLHEACCEVKVDPFKVKEWLQNAQIRGMHGLSRLMKRAADQALPDGQQEQAFRDYCDFIVSELGGYV